MTFAEQLRVERKRLGITQAQADSLLEIGRGTIAGWESERFTPQAITQEGALARLRSAKAKRAKAENKEAS